MKNVVLQLGVVLGILSSFGLEIKGVVAQSIVPADDGTMTIVTQEGQTFHIDGGSLSQDGRNLFHSLKEFGLSPQQIANFLSNPNVQNILTRVTGGNPSTIEGLIKVTGGNSNLFIMNPAGIIFGKGASLNVPADFTATTATGIGFGDGVFNAFGSNDYLNLIGSPTSFHFQDASGTIINAGDLVLVPGHSLSLLAGTVINTGTIDTPEGKITIASVPGTSKIRISQAGSPLSLELELPTDSSGGEMPITVLDLPELLTGNAEIDADLTVNSDGNVQLNQTTIPTDGGTSIVGGRVRANGGEIQIRGDKVGVIGGNLDASGDSGGSITIGGDYQGLGSFNAEVTVIDADSVVSADAVSNANGGKIVVWSNATTRIYGSLSATGSQGGLIETSSGGFLDITTTPDVSGSGSGGRWLIDPYNIIIVSDVDSDIPQVDATNPFVADADNFQLDVDLIEAALTGGATVTVSTNPDAGSQEGNITLATPLDYDGTGSNTLELLAAGNIIIEPDGPIFDGDIDTTPNDSLNLTLLADQNNDGVGGVLIDASISTGGGNLTAVGNDSSVEEFSSESVRVNNQILSGGGNVSLTGNSTSGVGVNVLESANIDSAGGNITIDGTTTNTAINAQAVEIDSEITSGNGNISITGTAASGNDIVVENSINSGTGDLTITANNPDLGSNTAVLIGSGSLLVQPTDASTNITLGGNINTETFLNEAELANIENGFNSITIGRTDGTGTITIDTSGNGNNNLTFNDPTTIQTPSGSIIVNAPINSIDNASITLTGNTTDLSRNITTSGNPIEINSNVVLGSDISLETTAQSSLGAAINLNGTVDGSFDLTLDAGSGNIGINGNVGSSTPLENLTSNGTGTTQINTETINTSGDQTFNGTVEIGADTVLSGNDITFNSTVGSVAGQNNSLTVNANDIFFEEINDIGVVTFSGAVGENERVLANLTVNTETGETSIDGGVINTTETQTYSSPIRLGTDTNFIADTDNNSSGSFSVGSNQDIVTNGNNINITAATIDTGNIDASGTDADGAIAISANSITTGDLTTNNNNITLDGATVLNRDITISTGGDSDGNINLNSTVDGNGQLNLEAGSGEVILNGAVGNNTPIQNLTVSASRLQVGNDITTDNRDLSFNTPVDLIGDATFNVGAASISFNNQLTINGNALSLQADSQINFPSQATATDGGEISLQPNNPSRSVLVNGVDSASLSVSNLNNLENLTSWNIGGENFTSTITVANPLATDANITLEAANLDINANITGLENASVFLFASEIVNLNADINTTGNLIAIDGDVVLGNNAAISTATENIESESNNNSISISGSINAASGGEQSLTLNGGSGTVILSDTVGTEGALNSLTINASSINLSAVQVNTTGSQTYSGNIISDTDTIFTANNGAVIGESIDSFGNNVTITAASINLGDINTSTEESVDTTNSGDVSLTSTSGAITTGNIDTSSSNSNAGAVSMNSATTVDTGAVTSFSIERDAGEIEINASDNITVDYLDAASDGGAGADVTIVTEGLFLALESFEGEFTGEDSPFSISTVGVESDGRVRIEHGGGLTNPFVVNFGENIPESDNGTAGVIVTNQSTIESGSFSFNQIRDNIEIVSGIDQTIEELEIDEIPEAIQENNDPSNNAALPPDTLQTAYLPSQSQIASLAETTEALKAIAQTTAVKPALIYVSFSPANLSSSFTQLETNLTQQYDQYLTAVEKNVDINLAIPPAPSDTLELIVVTEEGEALPVRVNVSRQQVLATAAEFYRQVEQLGDRYLEPAQQLYQWLVAPIEAQLQAQGIENLVYVMPDGLRLVPLAALYDASTDQYLAQKYNSGLAPSVTLTRIGYSNVKTAPVLAMGASVFEADELQSDLPAVAVEVPLIAEQIREGEFFLDANFTRENLIEARNEYPFPIVHLATHADFNPGDIENSYIQLYDSKLQLDDLRALQLHQPPVDLLVISACRSAFGDTNAELGFAGLASQIGVNSVVASLWYVGDTGTLALMNEFYRELETAPIRAEALRQAQIAMITGQVQKESDQIISRRGEQVRTLSLPPDAAFGTDDLSHPFYWAAFTMIGSSW